MLACAEGSLFRQTKPIEMVEEQHGLTLKGSSGRKHKVSQDEHEDHEDLCKGKGEFCTSKGDCCIYPYNSKNPKNRMSCIKNKGSNKAKCYRRKKNKRNGLIEAE